MGVPQLVNHSPLPVCKLFLVPSLLLRLKLSWTFVSGFYVAIRLMHIQFFEEPSTCVPEGRGPLSSPGSGPCWVWSLFFLWPF